MLKFSVPEGSKQKTPICMTMDMEDDGDVAVKANGVPVLWVSTNGQVYFNQGQCSQLKKLGFMLDGGQVSVRQ